MPAPRDQALGYALVRLLQDGLPVASGNGAIAEAARLLRAGEVVAVPTDTVYGLAAALDAPDAMTAIFRIKGRPASQTLPVLIADVTSAGKLMAESRSRGRSTDRLMRLANQYWPGGLTVAVPARSGLPAPVVAPDGTIGLRIPAHPAARRLIGLAGGALAVTSANRSGQPPAADADAIAVQFGAQGDHPWWVLDDGAAPGGQASTVIGCDGDRLVIHRAGAVDPGALRMAWATLGEPHAGLAG